MRVAIVGVLLTVLGTAGPASAQEPVTCNHCNYCKSHGH
jgi:hypothetical protein